MNSEVAVERYSRTIRVDGPPVPAVRMTTRSKHRNRQAQRYLSYKEAVGWAHKERYGNCEPLDGPVVIAVAVFLAHPERRRWDASNVLKACEDGLNGLAYHDDKQIVEASIAIRQSDEEGDYVMVEVEGE